MDGGRNEKGIRQCGPTSCSLEHSPRSGGKGAGNAGAPTAEAALGSSQNGNTAEDDGDEAAGRAEEAGEGEGKENGRSGATCQNEQPHGTDAPTGMRLRRGSPAGRT